MEKYCPECGEVVDSDDTFCFYCGERLPGPSGTGIQTATDEPRCPECGVSVEADDAFCYYCGERLQ